MHALSAASWAALCVCCLFSAAMTASLHKREAVEGSSDKDIKECSNITPCGWLVYVPYTRSIDYFMKNTCDCPIDKVCRHAADDLSVSAYVYRCVMHGPSSSTTDS